MKKGKEWLKEAVGELNLVDTVFEADGVSYIDTAVSVMQVYDLIDQLDEPEKVVIPKFVADEFDYNKNPYWEVDEAKDIPHVLKCAFGNKEKPSEFLDWVRDNPEDYVMAVRNGYEVEKEELYQVIIPTKDTAWKYYYLDHDGGINVGNDLEYVECHTEAFIRSVSDDLWQFAVEVAE